MEALYRMPLSLATEELSVDVTALERDPVEALARFGATMILSRYIEAEVSAHLGRLYERTTSVGKPQRPPPAEGLVQRGTLDIDFPKVRGSETPFRSQVLNALAAYERDGYGDVAAALHRGASRGTSSGR